jgi:hypothetical protein
VREWVKSDPDFDSIREDSEFKELISKYSVVSDGQFKNFKFKNLASTAPDAGGVALLKVSEAFSKLFLI